MTPNQVAAAAVPDLLKATTVSDPVAVNFVNVPAEEGRASPVSIRFLSEDLRT